MPAVIPSKTKRTSRRLTVAEREKAAKYKIETGVTYAQLSKWVEEQIGIKVPATYVLCRTKYMIWCLPEKSILYYTSPRSARFTTLT